MPLSPRMVTIEEGIQTEEAWGCAKRRREFSHRTSDDLGCGRVLFSNFCNSTIRERERERARERERGRERETERQTNRPTDGRMDGRTDREADGQTDRWRERERKREHVVLYDWWQLLLLGSFT